MSDFYAQPETVTKAIEPLRYHGNEVILFHILDPQEVRPVLRDPKLVLDMETGDALEVSPDYVKHEYGSRIDGHIDGLRSAAQRAGLSYFLLNTGRPLDEALREYLSVRQGKR
jgi:hypothetical protein